MNRGLVLNEEGAFQGYTLFSPLADDEVYLIDMEGEVVHSWQLERSGSCVYLLDDGSILQCLEEPENPRFRGGGLCGRMEILDWEGNKTWSWSFMSDSGTQHHDVELMPNGNILFVAWEHLPQEDALMLGRDPEFVGPGGMWPDVVYEVKPLPPDDVEVVWEWHSWDHLIQDLDEEAAGYGSPADEVGRIDINADHRDQPPLTAAEKERRRKIEEEMQALGYVGGDEEEEEDGGDDRRDGRRREREPDWLHTNAVDYHAGHDLIALSTPNLNEVWIIDHSTTTEEAASPFGGRREQGGDLLWRWGNPRNYGAGTNRDRRFFYQHNPTFIDGEDGELRLLVYNNGGGRPDGDYSSVEELVLPFDPDKGFLREPGEAFGPEEPAWIYQEKGDFFSSFISGAQRLPNGNTLICEGSTGRLIEVTPAGERVWLYENVYGGDTDRGENAPPVPPKAIFRCLRYGVDHPGVARLRD